MERRINSPQRYNFDDIPRPNTNDIRQSRKLSRPIYWTLYMRLRYSSGRFMLLGVVVVCTVAIFCLLVALWLTQKQIETIVKVENNPQLGYQLKGKDRFGKSDVTIETSDYDFKDNFRVIHVAWEFGPATYGGLGVLLTDLTKAQLRLGIEASAMLPYHKYLDSEHFEQPAQFDRRLCMQVNTVVGSNPVVRFLKMLYTSGPSEVCFSVYRARFRGITLFLISPSESYPFNLAFSAEEEMGIYDVAYGLTHPWQSMYFFKACALFMESFTSESPIKTVFHVHGAASAQSLLFRDQLQNAAAASTSNFLATKPKTFYSVYTIHDYSYEFTRSSDISDLLVFSPPGYTSADFDSRFLDYNLFYASGHGISKSDVVSFVSNTLAVNLTNGDLPINLPRMFIPAIQNKARSSRFFGISNAASFERLNPFTDSLLIAEQLNVKLDPKLHLGLVDNMPNIQTGCDSFSHCKRQAKAHLLGKSKIFPSNMSSDVPILLFVGRFTAEKGIHQCLAAVSFVRKLGAHLVLLGKMHYTSPQAMILKAKQENSDVLTIVDADSDQNKYSIFLRLAADYVIVPSEAESFGLVAAEGLLFGAGVISTGVGGLMEFLFDHSHSPVLKRPYWNAYLYSRGTNELAKFELATKKALYDLQILESSGELEQLRWRWAKQALGMGWFGETVSSIDDPSFDQARPKGGLIYQYLALYRMALQS